MSTRSIMGPTLAALLIVLPSAADAQSPQSVPASITVVVAAPPLTLTKVQDFDFGTVYTNQGVVSSGLSNFARWDGTTANNSTISISFQIPGQLTGPGTVLFACGATSASITEGVGAVNFDPAVGHAGYNVSVNGQFFISLGAFVNQLPTDNCSIDVTGAVPGTYTGTVTLTVAVI